MCRACCTTVSALEKRDSLARVAARFASARGNAELFLIASRNICSAATSFPCWPLARRYRYHFPSRQIPFSSDLPRSFWGVVRLAAVPPGYLLSMQRILCLFLSSCQAFIASAGPRLIDLLLVFAAEKHHNCLTFPRTVLGPAKINVDCVNLRGTPPVPLVRPSV